MPWKVVEGPVSPKVVMGVPALLGLLFLTSGLAAELSGNASLHVLDWSGDLSESLGELYDSHRDCDFIIAMVASLNASETPGLNTELCAHRLILSLNSEASLLLGDGGNTSTISVDEECLLYVDAFVRYLYTRRIGITLSSVKCFHRIASAYQAPKLKEYCAQLFSLLIPEDPTFQAQLELYNNALSSQDPLLEALCLQFLAWNCEAFSTSNAWLGLSPQQLQALLIRSDVVVEDELSLLSALGRWRTSNLLEENLLEEIRFPMIPPEDLFQLQFNLPFYEDFKAFFQLRILQALEFHTVSFQTLSLYVNLTELAYVPRIYTSATWSLQMNAKDSNTYYGLYQSFQTSRSPSLLFKAQTMSWNAGFQPTIESCWNHGLSTCSADALPLLSLTNTAYYDSTIRYENKVVMLCQGAVITAVQEFKDNLLTVPNAANGSLFPCPSDYDSFTFVIRPLYVPLPDSSGLGQN